MYSKYYLNVVLQMFSVKLALPQACSIIFESVCVWGPGKSKILDKQKQRASSPIIKILIRVVYVGGWGLGGLGWGLGVRGVGGGGWLGLNMPSMYN